MTGLRRLPIAPRPEDDELLSSWQARVACRYGLTPDELARWLGILGHEQRAGFMEHDFAPSTETVQSWASACGLPEQRIENMSLSPLKRPSTWFVWGKGRAMAAFRWPVCPDCLAEDEAGGRDHYFRRSWVLVETLNCDRHHRPLEEACHHCQGSSGFRFVLDHAVARLACTACGRLLDTSQRIRRNGCSADIFEPLSASIAKALIDQHEMAHRVMDTAQLLWTRPRLRTGRRLPFVVDVLPGLRLPPSVEARVDPAEPLATAPLGWRMVTLVGVATLLNLDGRWADIGRARFTIAQIKEWTEERKPRRQLNEMTLPPAEDLPDFRPLRSDAEYLALARSIVGSEKWREAQTRDARTRRKVLGAMIGTVLNLSLDA